MYEREPFFKGKLQKVWGYYSFQLDKGIHRTKVPIMSKRCVLFSPSLTLTFELSLINFLRALDTDTVKYILEACQFMFPFKFHPISDNFKFAFACH